MISTALSFIVLELKCVRFVVGNADASVTFCDQIDQIESQIDINELHSCVSPPSCLCGITPWWLRPAAE